MGGESVEQKSGSAVGFGSVLGQASYRGSRPIPGKVVAQLVRSQYHFRPIEPLLRMPQEKRYGGHEGGPCCPSTKYQTKVVRRGRR